MGMLNLASYVGDMSATCRRHVHMSPISRRHCMSIQQGEGSDICFFCQKLPTANKTTTNLMPPKKKKKKRKDVVTATAAAADAAAAPPIKPYFGANGEATSRAASLPPLPGFETFRANSATAPPLLLLAGQSTANSAAAPNLLSSAVQSTARAAAACLDLSYHLSPQYRQFAERPIQQQHRHQYATTIY